MSVEEERRSVCIRLNRNLKNGLVYHCSRGTRLLGTKKYIYKFQIGQKFDRFKNLNEQQYKAADLRKKNYVMKKIYDKFTCLISNQNTLYYGQLTMTFTYIRRTFAEYPVLGSGYLFSMSHNLTMNRKSKLLGLSRERKFCLYSHYDMVVHCLYSMQFP